MTLTAFKSANMTYAGKEWTNPVKEHLTWWPLTRKRSQTCFWINCCHGLWKKCPRAIKMTLFQFICSIIYTFKFTKNEKTPSNWSFMNTKMYKSIGLVCLPWMTPMYPKSTNWDSGLVRLFKITFEHHTVCARLILIDETIPKMYMNMGVCQGQKVTFFT